MGAAPQTVRKGRKVDQVLEGARAIFMRDGFEGASVDDIARAAGVSKATMYAYFPDKRLLFMEVAKGECCRQAAEAEALVDDATSPEVALTIAATKMVEFFTSDFGMKMFRMCVAESDRFPELGREFYESGPALARAVLVDFIRERVERGQMACDDFELAADQFAELCKADLFHRLVFGIRPGITDADRQRVIRGAVETFLARYGVKG